ncbi:PAS domain-containing protein [Rhodobacter capsulatus]|uniref:PAS/PAC sensor domain protein n=1 Tax=Rhodobacter capsulatus (strain ATCC BAA-309 / NBRC 16581 / SB1003) TaxID=272942 RepID=D5AR95_RHOCB|nr:PAS domain-containing protein [Rhodobacter capsulatus]ADE86900.1 PAS/PAC sensor domain protein [Rhodobacter capsulatus SB 1003]ETD00433.1 histidine kinase [Rhodobacter capsulatus DE442]ETD74773.1 histidine kinase [Rhodobacter capsulatus R121]ETD80496.1 histidine kinase [Rhodobacter capsulatus B6]ETE52339.1 histidine kinase [Rhodobacter capsulatus Y262]
MTAPTDLSKSQENEAPFGFDELFYSRTDKRGVIIAGNEVFHRVSGFDWSELLGAPHKIVRHPDTPRGVFRILWSALGAGHPMGAYVKNRVRNGDIYWVFAVLMPVDGGYLSVRLKPSTQLFDRFREVYVKLSTRERAERLDPEVSAGELRALALAEGFSSYTSYMAFALGQELAARDARLGRPADPRTQRLIDMNKSLERVTQEQTKLLRSFEALQSIPNNMRIVASRLEPSGGPVSAISENYKASSLVISERLRSFVAGRDNLCDRVSRQAARALFLLGSNRVLKEMNAGFRDVAAVEGIDWNVERNLLRELEARSYADTRDAMMRAVGHAEELFRASAEIRRLMLGLDTIRVLGRVECGRMRDSSGGLSATIDQLDIFHADIKNRLESIMRLSEEIGSSMNQFMRADSR